MRLLHSTELSFQDFFDEDIPRYAILSHRWGTDEISFQEMQFLLLSPEDQARVLTPALLKAETKAEGQGYRKVLDFCTFAAARGYEWVWVDTVCIDKASSAELSEAINSMWKWYENADRCYAYLSDVSSSSPGSSDLEAEFRQSHWFKRGWTLQELIAPWRVDFLNAHWQLIGTKADQSAAIESICGIPARCLLHKHKRLSAYTVAMRMSWACQRQTSRQEDTAYCLMGLFSVNMPLLYGEGDRAFARLCEEILKTSNDDSIFLHSGAGPLPRSPGVFSGGWYSRLRYERGPVHETNMYSLSNGYLHVQNARFWRWVLNAEIFGHLHVKFLRLNCWDEFRQATVMIRQDEGEDFEKINVSGDTPQEQLFQYCRFRGLAYSNDRSLEAEDERTALYIAL